MPAPDVTTTTATFSAPAKETPLVFLGHTFDTATVSLESVPNPDPADPRPAIVGVALSGYVGGVLTYTDRFPDRFQRELVETLLRTAKGIGFAEIIQFNQRQMAQQS